MIVYIIAAEREFQLGSQSSHVPSYFSLLKAGLPEEVAPPGLGSLSPYCVLVVMPGAQHHAGELVAMAEPLNSQQRPLSTIAEDTVSAENSMERLEDASPTLRAASDECERGEWREQQDNSLPSPQREDGLLVKSATVGNGGVEKGDMATRAKGKLRSSSSFDEPTERQKAILGRVLSQWKRTARRSQKEECTPSENTRTSYSYDHTLNYQ